MFTGKMNLELKKRIMKCLVWSAALLVAETATFTQTHFKGFEMWIWRRIEKIGWLDKVTDEEVFRRVNEDRQVLNSIWQRKHRLFETWQTFCMLIIKGRMRGKPTRGRRRIQCYTI